MNQLNMSNMEIEEFCEALVLDYIRKHNAPTDYIGKIFESLQSKR